MHNLHDLVENKLEAPGLAWSNLAYYWGMSAFGLGPAYIDYMATDAATTDLAFNAASNVEINVIAGLERRLTLKERFDRAINFYAYCFEQGRRSAINPPYDAPPTVDELMASRLRMENKPPSPDKLIIATTASLLSPQQQKLWALGAKQQREERSQSYNDRVLDCLQYVASELRSIITPDQLGETGFLVTGETGMRFNITADRMDQAMPEAVQDRKFGTCYIEPSSTGPSSLILSGIFGAYYTMGHNLELAMFDDESKRRLTSTYHAVIHTWRQLEEISHEEECI